MRLNGSSEREILAKTTDDTTFIYGQVTSEGYGAVVTEKHTYPRGILLITVTKSYGNATGRIVSEVKKYVSRETFLNDDPTSWSRTELYALTRDTIITYVNRNGLQETYTFRLPVVTGTIAASPEATREKVRFARDRRIVTETRDGNGALLETRESSAMPDGSLITLILYSDGTWRSSRINRRELLTRRIHLAQSASRLQDQPARTSQPSRELHSRLPGTVADIRTDERFGRSRITVVIKRYQRTLPPTQNPPTLNPYSWGGRKSSPNSCKISGTGATP